MEQENFSNFLKYGCDLGLLMGSHLKLSRPPYWVRCIEKLNHMICKKITESYIVDKIPESQRFPKIRQKFSALYNHFEEELSEPFIKITEEGKKVNTEWLKIEGKANFEPDNVKDEDEDDIKIQIRQNITVDRENRGISITILPKTSEEDVDAEFPLSEMFQAAILLERYSKKNISYPYCVLYFIYGCIFYSVPDCSPQIFNELKIFRKYSCIKHGNIKDIVGANKTRISGYLEKNSYLINKMGDKMEDEINQLTDENVDEIANMTNVALDNKDSLFDLIKTFTGKNMDELGVDSLKSKVDQVLEEEKIEEILTVEQMFNKFK